MDRKYAEPCKAPGISYPDSVKTEVPLQKRETKLAQSQPPEKVFRCEKHEASSSQGSLFCEEVEEESFEESQLEIKDIYEEVSRLRRRVSRLNHMLGTNIPECPNIDLCEHEHMLLTMPDQIHPEILQIEIDNKKLNTQLTQLQPLEKSAVQAIKSVRDVQVKNKTLVDQLRSRIKELDSFKLTFEKHQVLCKERYWFLERNKASGTEIQNCGDRRANFIQNHLKKHVVKDEYEPRRKEALKVVLHLRRASENLQKYLSNEINNKKLELFQDVQQVN
ncbi:uncharacterized protein LOC108148244 [Drosophila elegans]|uniref:uncharacterized protein LOC108148244 n=1 Tax=Drosophila elegans TaxID=30023 RepID=UPI0007E5DD31|nr:uncharacterized protein LOC108148244 [Drosophila elegans]